MVYLKCEVIILTKNKTAVGYIRVSTEEQANEGYSLENQINEIKRKCEYERLDLLKIYEDKGISGALLNERPGIISMLRDIIEKKLTTLLYIN